MARPLKDIDEDQVIELAKIHCTYEEMAAVLDCNISTLKRRFAPVIEKGREDGKMSLRRTMFRKALEGNVVLLIWLSKQHLGMSEKVEQKVDAEVRPRLNIPEGDERQGALT